MEKKFRITVDGRQYDVTVEDLSETPSYTIPSPGDMSVPTTPTPAPAAAAPTSAAGPGDEVCPLAGVVISIEVAPGQTVKEGDKVMTVEAMKMKTAVISHHNGQVKNIAVKVGDAVEAGQVLLTIG